ncbi:hypothetical protein [Desulfuromonas sp.]|uniref:hypothetical protein n=1 Tax=Desulfuromonas sp. TaxID=892 RepID=UPI0025C28A3C|nr:hypothetical protein [Desulfuromonas sp.]
MKKMVFPIIILLYFLTGCDVFDKKVEIKTLEDVFASVTIGLNVSEMPPVFARTSNNEYDAYVEGFSVKVKVKNNKVSFIETESKFRAGDHSMMSTYKKFRNTIFFSQHPSLTGAIKEDTSTDSYSNTTKTNTYNNEFCTYENHSQMYIEKKLPYGFIKMRYSGGKNAPRCDNLARARRDGWDVVATDGKLAIWSHD